MDEMQRRLAEAVLKIDRENTEGMKAEAAAFMANAPVDTQHILSVVVKQADDRLQALYEFEQTNAVELARWEARGGKRFISLLCRPDNSFFYRGDGCGGNLAAKTYEQAIAELTGPHGAVTVLKADFRSTKQVK